MYKNNRNLIALELKRHFNNAHILSVTPITAFYDHNNKVIGGKFECVVSLSARWVKGMVVRTNLRTVAVYL
jgi:hypothetical protein